MAGILNFIVVAGSAFLGVRLFVTGLYRRYWAFFFYLIFNALREGVVSTLDPSKRTYLHFWGVTEPLEWLLLVLVVLELYSLVLQDYRGLSTVGRWAMIAAVVVALAASGLSLLAPSFHTTQGRMMTYYYAAERAVYFSLVFFLLTILFVLMQYPITLSRNVILHSFVFSVYFLSNTMIFTILSARNFSPGLIQAAQYAVALLNMTALGIWLARLTPAGELQKVRLRPTWMPGREEVLVGQLNQLNAALLRATRK